MNESSRRRVLPLLALALLAAQTAGATTYIMSTDSELYAQAELVLVGRVLSASAAPGRELPATDYLVQVEEIYKGFVLAGTIMVRVPGGINDDGIGALVWGAAVLSPGERAVLFLNAYPEGVYRVLHFGLGAFREMSVGGSRVAVRDLSQAHELELRDDPRGSERRRSHLPRDMEGFLHWLADQRIGHDRPADYFIDQSGVLEQVTARFTTTKPTPCGNGPRGVRWTEFDRNRTVTLSANQAGEPDLDGGGFTEFQQALKTWNDDPATTVRLRYGGKTGTSTGTSTFDGENTLFPNDPQDDIPGRFQGNGTLASTTIWFDCGISHRHKGETFLRLFEADIVTQNNLLLFFAGLGNPKRGYAQLLAHEVGHVIGIGHACGDASSPTCASDPRLNEALMRATAHPEPRGPTLAQDDREAVAFLYAGRSVAKGPTAPSNLLAVASAATEARLEWTDNATGETGYLVEESDGVGPFVLIAELGANSTQLTVVGIPEGALRVYRVRARNDDLFSAYSNEAAVTTVAGNGCTGDGDTLCLNADRFLVRTLFTTVGGSETAAQAVELTDNTGYFWFFRDSNVEVVIKVLTACGEAGNDHFWVFAGGLTNVEVVITVVDTDTGVTKIYRNPQSIPFLPIQDILAFPTC